MRTKPSTPQQYLATLPPQDKATVTAIHKAIRKAAPELKPCLQ